MTDTYRLAEKRIRITSLYPRVHELFAGYRAEGPADFDVETDQADIDFERETSVRKDRPEGLPRRTVSDAYLETLAVYRKICEALAEEDIVLFHCSALAMDGKAILFAAPSGTGKSTHARLWRERFGSRVTTINDDKPLLKVGESAVTVYGTPYGGKDGLQTNTSAPVAAVVVLRQGPENVIRPLTPGEAFPLLLNQTYRPAQRAKLARILPLVQRLSMLPVFSLACTISPEAAELAYAALVREGILP